VLAGNQVTPTSGGQTYSFSYTYNLAGALKTETLPSGRAITSAYDSAGRMNGVTGQKSGESNKTYTASYSFAAQGGVAAMQLGSLWEHTNFNERLQPTQIGLGTSSSDSSKLRLDYGYGTTNNNGNVASQNIVIGGTTFSQSYGYDALNRLTSASEGSNWSQTYGYDRYGNRAVTAGSSYETGSAMIPVALTEYNTASNRFNSPSVYDSAGNLTSDKTGRTMAYDAENRQTQFNAGLGIASYAYDGDGRRVKKVYNVVSAGSDRLKPAL
jgi:YD repeat-containing protein